MKRIIFLLGCSVLAISSYSQDATELNAKLSVTAVAASSVRQPEVRVNPNPVTGETFNIELQNLGLGKYNVYLYDHKGKKYLVKALNLETQSFSGSLPLPKKAGKGIYILQVIGTDTNMRFSKKVIIE